MLAASHPASANASTASTVGTNSHTPAPISSNGTTNGAYQNNVGKKNKKRHTQTNKRVEISNFVSKFQKKIGNGWDAYQTAVSLFIVGKLSRSELMDQIAPVLSKKETRHMHNKLLMSMLANCYRIEPLDGISTSLFGNTSKKRKLGNKSSQYEKLKKDVLSLSIRERVRIKGITRESGKKGMIQNVMVLSRQAMVPKVPIVTNHHKNNRENSNTNSSSVTSNKNTIKGNTTNTQSNGEDTANVKSTNNLEMTLVSVKDILDMINEPLCTETYELPERKRMRDIMLGLAREHGLLGGVSMKAVDVLYLGLQYHLKSIISNVIDNVRAKQEDKIENKRNDDINDGDIGRVGDISLPDGIIYGSDLKRKSLTITTEDLHDTLTLTPHSIQPYGTVDYLNDIMLKNDDDYELISRQAIEYNKKHHSVKNKIMSTYKNDNNENIISINGDGLENNNHLYTVPNKLTDVSYLLKPHDTILKENTVQPGDSVPKINLALKDKDIGTPDELNWVLNDLLGEDM